MDRIRKFLLGRALKSEAISHEKMNVFWGLPIMSSDAISSVAYAVEEILIALAPVLSVLAVGYVALVSMPILLLLVMLVFSYTQIIKHYPNGGGAYIVSSENFGKSISLLAASCLIIDYIMTVAVSVSSSTAAIVSAFPALAPYPVFISVFCLTIVTIINLRGVTESAKIFGLPTYLFIIGMGLLVIVGCTKLFTGNLVPLSYPQYQNQPPLIQSITPVLFLRAFSGGCSALTGVEAISNAIPNFKDPAQRTAKRVLFLLAAAIIFIFGGTCILATGLKVLPLPNYTVIAQMADSIFGRGFMFYFIQFTTSLILLLAVNTAFNGLPMLLRILAHDRYMPHQFSQRGTKLSLSNGILFVYIVAVVLIIAFKSQTHLLIPFYAVGVFVSFTFSQAGMFIKWLREKPKGWYYKSLISLIGAIISGIGTIVVFTSKFIYGAWALLIVIPLIMFFMNFTFRYYKNIYKAIDIGNYDYKYVKSEATDKRPVIVLIHNMNKATLKTFDYARDLSSNVTALHFSTTPHHTMKLKQYWEELKIGIPLTIIDAPYRDILEPLEEYITKREIELGKGEDITIVLTKFVSANISNTFFHNHTTFFLESRLRRHRHVITVLVPYILN